MLDRIRNLSRMGARYFCDRVGLANNEEVLDLADVILRLAFDGVPIRGVIKLVMSSRSYELDNKEVSCIGLMPEQWGSDEVAVEGWDSLSWLYIAKLHKRRFILWFQYKWLSEVALKTNQAASHQMLSMPTLGICSSFSLFFR